MSKTILIFAAFAVLVCGNEIEDGEQKKRGAGKTTLNAIPTGAQKPDYTYNIYSQSPSSQGSQSTAYQPQVANSFYPNQASQYYSASNQPAEVSSGYSAQPQINLIPPPNPSQFVPINFVPTPGYQSKYQIVPSKTANGIQLALIQQPSNYQSPPYLQYPQALFAPNGGHQINAQQNQLLSSLSPPGQFNLNPQYQQLSLSNPYLGQPSPMFVVAQPNAAPYSNLLYPGTNPTQSFYNYYPSNAQQKYNLSYGSSPQPAVEYEKTPGAVPQNLPKEDNDIAGHGNDFVPSESNTSYKNAYATSHGGSYSKLK